MPLEGDVRYRWKNGVRLAFRGNKVVEVKKKGGTAHAVNRTARRRRNKR
jgi:hypothetical protein